MILLTTGLIKRSYDEQCNQESDLPDSEDTSNINHRIEVCKEILFLLPIIICSIFSFLIAKHVPSVRSWWANILQFYLVSGFLGSLWGYCIGCAIVWMTRIFGTIAFGKEAMGLGDVHLMGAAGAIIGPVLVVVAFFVAPFLGLAWAVVQMFFKKTRQIPYGPFLSMGIITVMILHDRIILYFVSFFYR
jgi:leader peptidase (prepilin peptidase)/N-methyltransferase